MMILTLRSMGVAAVMCLIASSGQAQPTHNADLDLTLHMDPPPPFVPGSTSLLTLTFTNAGPDALPAVGAGSSGYPHLDFELFSLIASNPAPCTMYYDDFPGPPGQPSYLAATVFAGPINAGESKSCTVALRVAPIASGTYPLEFFATDGQVFVNEPTIANNRVQVLLQFTGPASAAASIPTLSLPALGLLVLGLFAATKKLPRTRR